MSFADSAQDRILHFLPLHHTHGIVNKLCCPLFGAHDHTILPESDSPRQDCHCERKRPGCVFTPMPRCVAQGDGVSEGPDGEACEDGARRGRQLALTIPSVRQQV